MVERGRREGREANVLNKILNKDFVKDHKESICGAAVVSIRAISAFKKH